MPSSQNQVPSPKVHYVSICFVFDSLCDIGWDILEDAVKWARDNGEPLALLIYLFIRERDANLRPLLTRQMEAKNKRESGGVPVGEQPQQPQKPGGGQNHDPLMQATELLVGALKDSEEKKAECVASAALMNAQLNQLNTDKQMKLFELLQKQNEVATNLVEKLNSIHEADELSKSLHLAQLRTALEHTNHLQKELGVPPMDVAEVLAKYK